MKKFFGIALLAVTSLFFNACQQSQCPNSFMKPHEDGLLRVAIDNDLTTMDPRRVRDLNTMSFIRMFYEGLVRAKADGTYEPAIAEKIDVSPDGKVYTIKLKETYWTNGERVEANDFIYAWKSMLSPGFPAPNAYQLYPIKNAKAIKEGKEFVDALGVFEKNKSTLVIELENPHPEFMQLLSTPFYFPVNYQWAKDYDDHPQAVNPGEVPINGPFVPKSWRQQDSLTAVPNPSYWDNKAIKLKKIELIYSDNNTALQMYKQDDVDWIGSPLSTLPMDALSALKKEKCVEMVPADGMFFIRMNTDKPPFNNANIRRAFSQAIDRQSIVDNITLSGKPSTTLVPENYKLGSVKAHDLYNPSKAASDFSKGLTELGINIANLPPITLSYVYSDRNHKIAQTLQRQWKTILGVDVALPPAEAKVTMDQIRRGDYMMAIGSWFADIHDPVNYLDVFKYKNNGTNNTGWESPKYVAALDKSALTSSTSDRNKELVTAESILLEDLPVVPLFEASFNYMKKPRVEGVFLSPLGYMDFKYASIAKYANDLPSNGD